MEEKINFEYCYFKTELGNFFLLNTEKDQDKVELIGDIIYIKRNSKHFETAIKIAPYEQFKYFGPLSKIDHPDIFQNVIRCNLVEYKKDQFYLWKSIDAFLNTKNVTILEYNNNEFVKFENPHLFKVFKAQP